MSLTVFLVICFLANLWAFIAYMLDKLAAVRSQRRISEKTLLGLTLLGGIGAISASNLFRHKNRKQPYRRNAEMLALIHLVLMIFFATLLA